MKSLLILTATLTCFSLMGCPQKSDQTVLKIGHGLNEQHPVHKALVFMGEKLKEKSNGKITLEIFPSEQLGSEREMIEQVQQGFLDMTKTSSSPLESFIPVMGVFSVPYVFRDHEHFWKVLKGPIGSKILQAGKEKNLIGLCYYDSGSRSFYTKDRPIMVPDDLKNPKPLKIRVQESKTSMAMVKALGAAPTPIAWGELYIALQTGIVDGAENNPPSFYTSRHYEVCNHYSLDEHSRVPDVVLISTKTWNKPKDYK
ncbi:MAG: TRAP transporter substrate-binding protein [Planctomycetes bacterium]|nr:TRAP transporter substrate-binding protein [Planctomycetota bacterium]